ncbi:MAG: M4 family metallopeptidase, partial [Bdellovibrionota bacterium]
KVSEEVIPLSGECNSANDNCWVHFNSTIPSHASYLIHEAIGREAAEQLYYITLTQNLTSQDNFKSAAEATMNTCAQLFDDSTCSAVADAFKEVGMM